MARVLPTLAFETTFIARGETVVGVDEVGRGALAGPLVLGAVAITTLSPPPDRLDDSKNVPPSRRERLAVSIDAWSAGWSIGVVTPDEIDRWGLSLALTIGTERAVMALPRRPTVVLIDGPIDFLRPRRDRARCGEPVAPQWLRTIATHTMIGGDGLSATIAAASIMAKVDRDARMVQLDGAAPEYGWRSNKGYGSAAHRGALREFGATVHHRRSWNLFGEADPIARVRGTPISPDDRSTPTQLQIADW
jgi:ribonuclease HII